MEDLSDIRSIPLLQLPSSTLRLLSKLLNSTKVLPTEGPVKWNRDWRGLASLVNISAEVEANIRNYNDKTGKVLELWLQSRPGTVGELLEHLATLDRFDVYDDIIVDIREQRQQVGPTNQVAIQNNIHNQIATTDDHELITFDDRPGHMHMYHAYVLSAEEDREFVTQMIRVLNANGFEICTRDSLRPGYASQYPPISKLISERCQRIILVYSPAFLQSHDNSFFRDYAQAISIEMNSRTMLPIVYKKCELPHHMRIYHMLYFNPDDMATLWDRLVRSLDITKYLVSGNRISPPALQVISNSNTNSAVNIVSMPVSTTHADDNGFFLPPSVPIKSPTPNTVAHKVDEHRHLPPSAPIRPLTPSNVSDSSNTVSLSQSLASLTLKPSKKPKRKFLPNFLNFLKRTNNKKNIGDTMKPVKQLCA